MERVNEVPIYRLEPRGGYLGRIDYSFVDTKKPIKFLISSERDEMEKRLERLITRSMQIKSEMAKSGKQDEMKVKELRFLESKQKELEKNLLAFEDKNFYKHTAIPVQLSVKDDPKIIKGVGNLPCRVSKIIQTKSGGASREGIAGKRDDRPNS